MYDQANSNQQNSYQTIEQAIEQTYLNFQAGFLPARSSSDQAKTLQVLQVQHCL